MTTVEKTLSANDTGETGGHQAGLLIPRRREVLDFFPALDPTVLNPRVVLDVVDDAGDEWTFNYIYYNNRLVTENGTRNEYRITGMTAFIRQHHLKAGDVVTFTKEARRYRIRFRRKDGLEVTESGRKILRLSGNWTVIDLE